MKRLALIAALLFWPLAFPTATMTLSGCASSPSSYKTLAITQAATSNALQAFGEARAKGKVSDAEFQKVNQAYRSYQSAYETALLAAKLNVDTATPAEVATLATALANAITVAIGGIE